MDTENSKTCPHWSWRDSWGKKVKFNKKQY